VSDGASASGGSRRPAPGSSRAKSVRTTQPGGAHGDDGANKRWGRQRQVLVARLGLLLTVVVPVASLHDRAGHRPPAGPLSGRPLRPGARCGWRAATAEPVRPGSKPRGVGRSEVVRHTPRHGGLPPATWWTRTWWYAPKASAMCPWVVERTFAGTGRSRPLSKDLGVPARERRGDGLSHQDPLAPRPSGSRRTLRPSHSPSSGVEVQTPCLRV
jgi:hypothetical protein